MRRAVLGAATGALLLLAATTGSTTGTVVDADGQPVANATVVVDGTTTRPTDHALLRLAGGLADLFAAINRGLAAFAGGDPCAVGGCPDEATVTTTDADGRFTASTPDNVAERGLVAALVTEPGGATTYVVTDPVSDLGVVPLWTTTPDTVLQDGFARRTGGVPAALLAAPGAEVISGRWSVTVDGRPLAQGSGALTAHLLEDATAEVRWTADVVAGQVRLLATSRPASVTGTDVPPTRGASCRVVDAPDTPATTPCAATDGDLVTTAHTLGGTDQLLVELGAVHDGTRIVVRGRDLELDVRSPGGAWASIVTPSGHGDTLVFTTNAEVDAVMLTPDPDVGTATVAEVAAWPLGVEASEQAALDAALDEAAAASGDDGTTGTGAAMVAQLQQLLPLVLLAGAAAVWTIARTRPGRRR